MKEVIEEKAEPKKWVFRRLTAKDIWLVTPILKKVGINNIRKCFNQDIIGGLVDFADKKNYDDQVNAATFGAMLEFLQIVVEGADSCENDLFNLLSKTSNLSRAEVENLDPVELPLMIIDFVKKEEFKSFFKVAQSLVK